MKSTSITEGVLVWALVHAPYLNSFCCSIASGLKVRLATNPNPANSGHNQSEFIMNTAIETKHIVNAHGVDITTLISDIKQNKALSIKIKEPGQPERNARLFVSTSGVLCEFSPRSRRYGRPINADLITEARERPTRSAVEKTSFLVEKYRKLASTAGFKNNFIDACLTADNTKSLSENGITTGNKIDGKVITVDRLRKYLGVREWERMTQAINTHLTGYRSGVFEMDGYDCRVETFLSGEKNFSCVLSVEFKGCANGFYYLLINEENFVGYDVD